MDPAARCPYLLGYTTRVCRVINTTLRTTADADLVGHFPVRVADPAALGIYISSVPKRQVPGSVQV